MSRAYPVILFWGSLAGAQEIDKSFLHKLSPHYVVQVRRPNSFVPNEQIIEAPLAKKHWTQNILAEDEFLKHLN